MMRIPLFMFLSFMLVSCNMFYDEQETMQEAKAAQEAGKHREAIIAYKKVLKKNGNNHDARVLLARSYLATGQGASAEKELRRAVTLGVSEQQLLVPIARSLLQQRNYERFLEEINLQQAADRKQYNMLLAMQGKAYLGVGEYGKAEDIFNRALKDNPENIDALASLASIEQKRGRFDKAIDLINKALTINNKVYELWLQKAVILQLQGLSDKAIELYNKVIQSAVTANLASLELQGRAQLVDLYLQNGDVNQAKSHIDILKQKNNNHPYVWYLSGAYHYQNKEYNSARIEFEKVISRIPSHEQTLLLLGATQYAEKNFEQANEYLTRFVNLQPTHIQARKLLGATRLHLDQPERALDVLKPGVNDHKSVDNELLILAGRAALQSKDKDALEYFKSAAKQSPENTDIRRELAKAYLAEGDSDKAVAELRKIKGKDALKAQSMVIQTYLKNGDHASASKAIDELLSTNKSNPTALYIAAISESVLGNRNKAYKHFQRAIDLKPDYVAAHIRLAHLYLEDGELTRATDVLNEVFAVDSDNIEAMLGFAQIEERRGNVSRAIEWLENARKSDTRTLLPRILLANYYIRVGNTQKALNIAREAVNANIDDPRALLLLSKTQVGAGELEEAEKSLNEIVAKYPSLTSAQIELVNLNLRLNQYDKARILLKDLIAKHPANLTYKIKLANLEIASGNADLALRIANRLKSNKDTKYVGHNLAGDIYMSQKEYKKAISEFNIAFEKLASPSTGVTMARAYHAIGEDKQAIGVLENLSKTNSSNVNVMNALGSLYQIMGRDEQAIAIYKKLLAREPENGSVLNNMALVMISHDKDKALDYALEAHRTLRGHPATQDTLGWVYFQRGDYDKALEMLKSASSSLNEPSVDYHYAEVLVKFGETKKASEILSRITAVKEPFPERNAALQLLQQIN